MRQGLGPETRRTPHSGQRGEIRFKTERQPEALLFERMRIALLIASIGLFGGAAPAFAHHSQAAEFDLHNTVTLNGVISKVDWMNPHVYLYLDVKDDKGQVTTWALESLPTRFYHNLGLSKAMLGEGKPVTVLIHPAKIEGKPLGWVLKLTYADGHAYEFGR
jgi:hypothetical protein